MRRSTETEGDPKDEPPREHAREHDNAPTRPVPILPIAAGVAIFAACVAGALSFKAARHGLGVARGAPGKQDIDHASDCRTSLAMTTACRGQNSSFQECHYYFRAEGVPDPQVCTAFLAGPDAGPAARVDEGPCPETRPAGWQTVACEDYHLDAKMVCCFRCFDGSQPESGRALLQAFDRACERGIVLKSCNEPLPGTVGL